MTQNKAAQLHPTNDVNKKRQLNFAAPEITPRMRQTFVQVN